MRIGRSIVSSMRTNLLIADDDEPFLEFVSSMVKLHYPSIKIHAVLDGKNALATAKAFPPKLVITDIAMPLIDGNRLCKSLRMAYGGRVKILAITGNRLSIDADFDAILSKPFSIDALFAMIDELLGIKAKSSNPAYF